MSIFRYPLEVGSPDASEFETIETLVDTGATFTVVPSPILLRLGVEPSQRARFRLADNTVIQRAIGETQVRIEGQTFSTIVVFGDEQMPVVLGVYTLERALLAVDPVGQRLVPTDALILSSQVVERSRRHVGLLGPHPRRC